MINRDQIIDKIISKLKYLNKSSFHQEPYTTYFFDLFAEAFNAGLLDRSSAGENAYLGIYRLTQAILNRSPELVDSSNPHTNWCHFYTAWEAWTYAWSRVDKCCRR